MELTPSRQKLIDAHIAETHRLMAHYAFELNDLVRFTLSAAKEKGNKVYYPMDPVNECVRNWRELNRKVAKLAAEIDRTTQRLGVPPFDAEEPPASDPQQ